MAEPLRQTLYNRNARIFTLPKEPPAIMVAASKPGAGELAGRMGDGLISFDPDADLVKAFEAARGKTHRGRGNFSGLSTARIDTPLCFKEASELSINR